jgi:hypothetical protein
MNKPVFGFILSVLALGGCAPRADVASEVPSVSADAIEPSAAEDLSFPIVDTGQGKCYNDAMEISCPSAEGVFFGQDAQYTGNEPQYRDNGDGTVTDGVTGLMWQQDPGEKMTYSQAAAGASAFRLAGHSNWRLPSIKELYSLILFDGTDVSGCNGTCNFTPFLDTRYFRFSYGDADAGERVIDSQFATATLYIETTMNGNPTMFGVNFADGRIKGYPTRKTFFVLYVRGNPDYGRNAFADNGDGTISDAATGLTWTQSDGGSAMNWKAALEYCEGLDFAGAADWRLPNAKELQSIADYTRTPALDPMFGATAIHNESGETDYPYYWSSTTHADSSSGGAWAAYVAFGRALGYMAELGGWIDVHGAGAQRSDPKAGESSDFPQGHGPQGDAVRILNHVRCVRGGSALPNPSGNPDAVRPTASIQSTGPDSDTPEGENPPGGAPPPEAVEACTDGAPGSPCSFAVPGGTVSGTCQRIRQQLACVPTNP